MKLNVGFSFSSTGIIIIIVNNTVRSEMLGTINGLAMTAASTSRYNEIVTCNNNYRTIAFR